MKPLLLDLFSGAGGSAYGYQRAGFTVVGCDINPMPRYIGDDFIQGDALMLLGDLLIGKSVQGYTLSDFSAIHASPICQQHSRTRRYTGRDHLDFIPQTRELLQMIGLPYVIENVEGAPLNATLVLCGTMFGLQVRRHRCFEMSVDNLQAPYSCGCKNGIKNHDILNIYNTKQANAFRDKHYPGESIVSAFKQVMGTEWMSDVEASQSFPPVYCEYIGTHLLQHVLAAH